jgi:hypothetical protein
MKWVQHKLKTPSVGDPYLQWAMDTKWQGFAIAADGKAQVPLLIELTVAAAGQKLHTLQLVTSGLARVPLLYAALPAPKTGRRYLSAFVRRDRLHELLLSQEVERFELSLPVPVATGTPQPCARPESKDGQVVIGVIDRGCAFLNGAFRQGWAGPGGQKTRILALWDQTQLPTGSYWHAPAGVGYGRELQAADIDHLIARQLAGESETRIYTELQHPLDAFGRVADRVHGTHVMDVAGGLVPPQAIAASAKPPAPDSAQKCGLIFVNLPAPTEKDTTAAATNASLLDGLHYILNRAGPGARVVVNLSVGGQGGPHDGTSLIDLAIEELMQQRQGLLITVAAGNSARERWSDTGLATPASPAELSWRLLPNDTTDSFLEVWSPCADPAAQTPLAATIDVTPPAPLPALKGLLPDESAVLFNDQNQPVCRLSYMKDSALGKGLVALLAVAPNSGPRTKAAAGVWQVKLNAALAGAVAFDAWIQRDAPPYATRDPIQSYFDHLGERDLGRGNPLNNLACGPSVLAVGACRLSDAEESSYSSRPQAGKESARLGKDSAVLAPADESAGVVGLFASGVETGAIYRMGGTSIAAPRVARHLACALVDSKAPIQAGTSASYIEGWLKSGLSLPAQKQKPRARHKLVVR